MIKNNISIRIIPSGKDSINSFFLTILFILQKATEIIIKLPHFVH